MIKLPPQPTIDQRLDANKEFYDPLKKEDDVACAVTSIAHLDQCVASYLTGVMLLAHRNEPDAPKAPRRRFRTLRIAWSVGWGVVAVLFVALWIRSYWWATNLENMTIGSRTLQCALVNGRIFVRSKPADHMQRVSLFQNYHKLDPEFYYWNQPSKSAFDFALNEFYTPGSIFFSFPYWFAILICGAFAAAPWLPYRFSLGTLLIATTLVAVVLGLIVGLRWMPSGGFFMRRMIYFVTVSLAALVRPSTYWTLAMLATVTLICLFGIYRAVTSSRGRSLWASFIAGLMAYWLVVVFVRELGSNEWSTYLGAPVWRLIHGDVSLFSVINGYSNSDLVSFVISLHFICAVLISGIATIVAHQLRIKDT